MERNQYKHPYTEGGRKVSCLNFRWGVSVPQLSPGCPVELVLC